MTEDDFRALLRADNPRRSEIAPDHQGAVDVDVSIGDTTGPVTLAPDPVTGRLMPIGHAPDLWIDPDLLRELVVVGALGGLTRWAVGRVVAEAARMAVAAGGPS